jgi:hypothetical protein
MPAVKSYPFPTRSSTPVEKIICRPPLGVMVDPGAYRRAQQEGARLHRLRYLSIEEELERAYRYVSPSEENGNTFSLKFAEIIRAAANAYEIFCKTLYASLYNDLDELNIFNYLALDNYLYMAHKKVSHLMAIGSFPSHPEVEQPFVNLASWDTASETQLSHKPAWWEAYNKVKHTDNGLKSHATLAHATASVAALFIMTETVFGCGILEGGVIQLGPGAPVPGAMSASAIFAPRWGRLFAMRA